MPYFLDVDFYLQISSAKSAIISNAVLPVPSHLHAWKDHFKIPNVFQTQQEMHLSEEEVELSDVRDIAHTLMHDVAIQVEAFESDDAPALCEEEIVPSSYPESDSSLPFCLNSGAKECSEGDGVKSRDIYGCKMTNFESFSKKDNMEGKHELEVPIMDNSFGRALSRLLVNNTVLKRLQRMFVDDPLLKPDKTPWTEKDFFDDSHQEQPVEVQSLNETPIEKFQLRSSNEVRMEDFLTPIVKSKDRECLVDDLHDLEGVRKRMNCLQQHCFGIDDIPKVNIDCLNSEDVQFESFGDLDISTLLAENINPPFDFGKEEICQFNPHNDQGIERNKSPVFGFPSISIYEAPSNGLDYFSDSDLRKKLVPFKEGDFLGECSLLTKKEYKQLKLELWESERHYDEERLLEPTLPNPLLPDLFERAMQLFPLEPEMGSLPYNKDNSEPGLQQYVSGVEDPSMTVVLIGLDFKMSEPPPVEIFTKAPVPFVETSDETINQRKDSPFFSPSDQFHKKASDNIGFEDHQGNDDSQREMQHQFDADNPLESFMQFRSHRAQSCSGHKEKDDVPKVAIEKEVDELTKTTSNSELTEKCLTKSGVLKIVFSGIHTEVSKCLGDFVSPHFDKLKQKGSIPHHQSFYATSVDRIRFLMNENVVQNQVSQNVESNETSLGTSDLTQSLNIVLRVRQALHLLIHSCFPSAIHHIASFNSSVKGNGPTHSLQEQLLRLHASFQQRPILHPKFDALLDVLRRDDELKTTTVILVQLGLISLVRELERILTETTSLSVNFVKNLEDVDVESLEASRMFVSFESPVTKASVEPFDLVIQYDASKSTVIKDLCKEMGKRYLGLVSDFNPSEGDVSTVPTEKSFVNRKSPITVIGSTEMMQHQQVIYILEARHAVMFIERNYTSVQLSHSLYHADVIFSLEVSLILLPLLELSTHDWNMEEFIKRVIAVGLQSQHCFILVHGIGVSSKYPLDKIVLQYLYRLRSSLSNLCRSSACFVAQYKVLVAMTQEDAALNINAIADYSVSKPLCDQEDRHFLKPDMTQDEAFLLQFVCLNSFSAQLLLCKFNLEEILTMSSKEIKESFPDFPDTVLKYFNHITAKLKSDQMSSCSSSSQVSARSTSQKSGCPSSSNPPPEFVHQSLLPSHSREGIPTQQTRHVNKSANVMQKQHGNAKSSDYCPKQGTFGRASNDVAIRKSFDESALCRVSGTSDANVTGHITYPPSSNCIKREVFGNLSSPENRHLASYDPKKRSSSLSQQDNVQSNKRAHNMYDPVFIDKYLTKGETAIRRPSVNADRVAETVSNDDINQLMMRGHQTERLQLRHNDNLNDVTGKYHDFETNHHKDRGLEHQLTMASMANGKLSEIRNQFYFDDGSQNQENRGLSISSMQIPESLQQLQQTKSTANEDDGQEMFFLGKSQNSPQVTHRSVNENDNDDDDVDEENSIIIVKSQETRRLQNSMNLYKDAHKTSYGSDMVCSIVPDYNENSPHCYNNNSSSSIPTTFQLPLSLSPVKPLSVSENLMNQLNPSTANSNKASPSPQIQSNTRHSAGYGIFSAKVGRKVKPMPAPERSLDLNSDKSLHNNQFTLGSQGFTGNYNVHNNPSDLPDVAQLPFSVSWDLRKHIKQTNTNALGINSRLSDCGNVGERISRVSSALKDRGTPHSQKKEMNSSNLVQNALCSASSSSHNTDFIKEKFIADENDMTNLGTYQSGMKEVKRVPGHHNVRGSDSLGNYSHDKTGPYFNSVQPVSKSYRFDKENRCITSMDPDGVLNEHSSQSSIYRARISKGNRPHSYSRSVDSVSYIGQPSQPALTDNQSRFNENRAPHQNASRIPTKLYFLHDIDKDERPKQKYVNPFQTQINVSNQSNADINQDVYPKSRDTLHRGDFMNEQLINNPSHQAYIDSRQYEPQSNHQLMQEIDRNSRYRDMTRFTGTHHETDAKSYYYANDSKDPYNYNHHFNKSSNRLNVNSDNRNHNQNSNENADRNSRTHLTKATPNNRPTDHQERDGAMTMTAYRDRSQERLPSSQSQPLPTNVVRQYSLPYTPRRNVSVGLAQPLPRSQEKLIQSSSTSDKGPYPHHSSTHHHHRHQPQQQQPPSQSQLLREPVHHRVEDHSLPHSSLSASPPMDLDNATDTQQTGSRDNNTASYEAHSAMKMKKWNSHLQRHAAQRFDYSKDQHNVAAMTGECPPRQKRLCMEKGDSDSNKGQMVLVFK